MCDIVNINQIIFLVCSKFNYLFGVVVPTPTGDRVTLTHWPKGKFGRTERKWDQPRPKSNNSNHILLRNISHMFILCSYSPYLFCHGFLAPHSTPLLQKRPSMSIPRNISYAHCHAAITSLIYYRVIIFNNNIRCWYLLVQSSLL